MSELLAAVARTLRTSKRALAARANEAFFRRHPDWDARFGERGRVRGEEDAAYLVEFLAGALDAGLVPAFEDYVRWTTRMLGARGIAATFVAESIEVMGDALKAHLGPAESIAVEPFLAAGHAASLSDAAAPVRPEGGLDLERQVFTQAILMGRRPAALNVALESLRRGTALLDVYADVIQESLYEVGRLWETNRITVADEHMATAIAQYVLARLYSETPSVAQSRGNAVVTGVEGELHQVGANIVADALEHDGWSVRFLGVNAPHAGVLRALDEHKATSIGISATMLASVARVRELVRAIRGREGARATRIVVGGAVFNRFPEIAYEVGADAAAIDVRTAVSAFRQAATTSPPKG